MKKALSILLAALLMFSVLPTAFAEEGVSSSLQSNEKVISVGDGESGYVLYETTETLGGGEVGYTAEQLFKAGDASTYSGSLYSQLTSRAKACFDSLDAISIGRIITAAENDGYKLLTERVSELYGIRLNGTISGSVFTANSASKAQERAVYTDICAAIVAMRFDRPDKLWTVDMRYGYRWNRVSNTQVQITDVIFGFKLLHDGKEAEMYAATTAAADAIAQQASQQPDTYSKVKAAHDLILEANSYNQSTDAYADMVSHCAYSALVDDEYLPVCDGYAKAFKMVMDRMGIPCVLPSSSTHMWNNVKMEDGRWYNVDLTWDDVDQEDMALRYDYFLIGSETEVGGTVFSKDKDHIEINPYVKTDRLNAVTFTYPTKSEEAYVYIGTDYEGPTFPDVSPDSWYYTYVEEAYDLGLFEGDTNGNFNPQKNLTRAEFCKVLASAMGVDVSTYSGSGFTDVAEDKWYAPYVAWAKSEALMQGYADNSFKPNDNISRQEMCLVLYNSLEKLGKASTYTGDYQFKDDAGISSWAKEGVYACYELGLVNGDTNGNFMPRANTKRSEAATMFVRYMAI